MVTMDGSLLRFDPSGELTIYQVEEATKELGRSISQAKELLIDLSQTDKIDTAGFQLLISITKTSNSAGKECLIKGLSGSIENFIALFGYEFDAQHKGEV